MTLLRSPINHFKLFVLGDFYARKSKLVLFPQTKGLGHFTEQKQTRWSGNRWRSILNWRRLSETRITNRSSQDSCPVLPKGHTLSHRTKCKKITKTLVERHRLIERVAKAWQESLLISRWLPRQLLSLDSKKSYFILGIKCKVSWRSKIHSVKCILCLVNWIRCLGSFLVSPFWRF